METKKYLAYRFEFWKEILDRKHWIMYLYPPPFELGELKEVFTGGRVNPVTKVIEKYTQAYMVDAAEPPPEIAGAIKNFADDIASGREVVVRAGDYIAIHNFVRAQKKSK
jgi:hypothetical protein